MAVYIANKGNPRRNIKVGHFVCPRCWCEWFATKDEYTYSNNCVPVMKCQCKRCDYNHDIYGELISIVDAEETLGRKINVN